MTMSQQPARDDRLRLFFAVFLAPELRDAAVAVQEDVGRVRARVKWVEPDNLHFTVKFLGDTPSSAVADLSDAARQVADRHGQFILHLAGVGAFPRPASPNAIWIGCTEGAAELCALAGDLERTLHEAGLAAPEARAFRAHLTIGRNKDRATNAALGEAIERAARTDLGCFAVTRLSLVRSELRPEGPVYSELHQFALAQGDGSHLG